MKPGRVSVTVRTGDTASGNLTTWWRLRLWCIDNVGPRDGEHQYKNGVWEGRSNRDPYTLTFEFDDFEKAAEFKLRFG